MGPMKIEASHPGHIQFAQSLNEVPIGSGLPLADDVRDELMEYCDVLLGRKPAPISSPYLALGEIATVYYARAQEIDMLIHEAEREGVVAKGSDLYKVRTGALRSFIEMAKRMAELGSRRLTQEQLLTEQRRTGSI